MGTPPVILARSNDPEGLAHPEGSRQRRAGDVDADVPNETGRPAAQAGLTGDHSADDRGLGLHRMHLNFAEYWSVRVGHGDQYRGESIQGFSGAGRRIPRSTDGASRCRI